MSVSSPRGARGLGLLALAALLVAGLPALPARAAVVRPRLELIASDDDVVMHRFGRRARVPLDLGAHVASMDAPFELLAQRPDYTQPPVLSQVLRGPLGETEVVPLDGTLMNGWEGLAGFFEITFVDEAGEVAATKTLDFCPGGFDRQRVDDSGPDQPAYPAGCYANPFTKGVIWGIDSGWAVPVGSGGFVTPRVTVPDGTYDVTVAIAPRFVEAFAIPAEGATIHLSATVERWSGDGCPRCGGGGGVVHGPISHRRHAVETIAPPDASTLPDLVSLPAWGIDVDNLRRDRARLSFGATVWTAGASDLVVEGFRRKGEATMDGFQYFYEDGAVVGKAPVGDLEFDDRDGHDHWHFRQFAAYSLLDENGGLVVESGKEAFCLAPTDAIDLTLPGADLNPTVGLSTACGSAGSIWTRETLPLGWGDTYFQSLPGQSFDVTDLPNGKYFIRVEANPGGLLHEQTAANNVELREIVLKGKPGSRRVEVPPWNGIDSEKGRRFGF